MPDNSRVIEHYLETPLGEAKMDRLPIEIWEQVLGDLLDSRDFMSAYSASTIWQSLLENSKAAWLFGQAFPFLFKYLSKRDILQIRNVCKLWCYGVDHFLENNAYQRPAVQEDRRSATTMKTDLRLDPLKRLFKNKLFFFNGSVESSKRTTMLLEAPTYSCCPIVGRSVWLTESESYKQMNTEFLQAVGIHIWFLKIRVHSPTFECFQRILQLLLYVPNLKSLRIEGMLFIGPPDHHQLPSYVTSFLTEGGRERLPKLEYLDISPNSSSHFGFSDSLLRALPTSDLQTLELNLTINVPNLDFANLVDLRLILSSDRVFPQLLQLSSPLRRLSLYLWGHVSSTTLLGAVKNFGKTLRHFELDMWPDYYTDFSFSVEQVRANMTAFLDPEILADATNLNSVALKGCPPPSLNFLCGLESKLEYLHLPAEYWQRGWSYLMDPVVKSLGTTSKIDFLTKAKRNSRMLCDGDGVYSSNVWRTFPKLKLLSVYFCKRDFEYWRDGGKILNVEAANDNSRPSVKRARRQ